MDVVAMDISSYLLDVDVHVPGTCIFPAKTMMKMHANANSNTNGE